MQKAAINFTGKIENFEEYEESMRRKNQWEVNDSEGSPPDELIKDRIKISIIVGAKENKSDKSSSRALTCKRGDILRIFPKLINGT